jgi:hypothetical protein
LGNGQKDVIVPFTAVKTAKKNDKWWLTLDETKQDLKNAPGFKYDKASTTWVRQNNPCGSSAPDSTPREAACFFVVCRV